MRWYAQDEVNQEDSEQNEVGGIKKTADSTGKAMHIGALFWSSKSQISPVQLRVLGCAVAAPLLSLYTGGNSSCGEKGGANRQMKDLHSKLM